MMLLVYLFLLFTVVFSKSPLKTSYDQCIVGAGGGGLQIGYFNHMANRDYVIFEKEPRAGTFFEKYPRRRKLISVNKKYTGSTDPEFNMRHDWNSLISHNDTMRMTSYTDEYFPDAGVLAHYFQEFAHQFDLNIQYNTEVKRVSRKSTTKGDFILQVSQGMMDHTVSCKRLILATGIGRPNGIGLISGEQYVQQYQTVDLDPERFKAKRVLIVGKV